MDLFGRRAREERIRKEVAMATRKELVSALVDIPLLITEHKTKWHNAVADTMCRTINQWFASRTEEQQRALHERFKKRVDLLLEQMPRDMIQKLAGTYRQTLIKNIGKQGKALFLANVQRRSVELVSAVQEEARKARNVTTSGEEALPNGTRFFFRTANGSRLYVIEQLPTVRTVQFHYKKYRLAFPFIVMIVHFDQLGEFSNLYVFFRNKRLQTIKDTLCIAALSNIDEGGKVCFPGSSFLSREGETPSIADTVERTMDSFWGSGFNNDLSENFQRSMRHIKQIRSLGRWQKKSAEDPHFVLSLDWLPYPHTLEAFIQDLLYVGHENDSPRIVSASLNRVAERVGDDIMESALQLVSKWNIDEVPSEILARSLDTLLSEGAKNVTDMVGDAAKEIFAQIPNLDHIAAEGEQSRTKLAQAVDERIKWIGLAHSTPSGESTNPQTVEKLW